MVKIFLFKSYLVPGIVASPQAISYGSSGVIDKVEL